MYINIARPVCDGYFLNNKWRMIMIDPENKVIAFEECHDFFEMANLAMRESGLPYDIWLDSVGNRRNVPHNALRIKVLVNGELIPVIIASKDNIKPIKKFRKFAAIAEWASENYDILYKHWHGKLTDREALILLAKDN